MASSQLERWFAEHPSAPRFTGRYNEVPLSYVVPRVGLGLAVAGVMWWLNAQFGQSYRPESLTPEFLAEVKRQGEVAPRMHGPPVYINPFAQKIPGSVRGPQDLNKD
ncbi:hypothetical protein HYH03_002407 [Edaphochlamys debaryana]|uniref:Uncharacterized protein n=1 Tax=Edaphochlamys debaryana TaxID=47281 RepID=A0A835YIY9_9CHLO|nr:hypothetical protein HYH03_002407 [Edaphochlamys debaryana]|eukprot:KAG2499460.1 hypothetical protein HYH03_002407 [Edaphochlamys debaryana]